MQPKTSRFMCTTHRMPFLLATVGAGALFLIPAFAHADTWDLRSDWSDVLNPNGVWTYRAGNVALPPSFAINDGSFSSPQPTWAVASNAHNYIPDLFKSVGAETFAHDWLPGDVVGHSQDDANGIGNGPLNVIWTSPITGVVDISGAVWSGRNIGRSNDWALLKNGVTLTGGSLPSSDLFTRANPFDFTAGSGGSSGVNLLSVVPGDVLELQITRTSTFGDLVGMNFTVNSVSASATPEPGSVAMLLGLTTTVGSLIWKRRRRR